MYFLMPNQKKCNSIFSKIFFFCELPLSLRGMKNSLRPIIRPTEYTHKMSQESVKLFRIAHASNVASSTGLCEHTTLFKIREFYSQIFDNPIS